MVIAKVIVNGTSLNLAWCHKIPKGIVGARVEIEYADDTWTALNRTVIFQSTVTKDILNTGSEVTVPPEVVATAGATLFMGIYGTDADNIVAIPTVWVALGTIQGAADPSGDTSTDPTLPVWAQMERRFEKLMQLADNPQVAVATPDWAATEADPGYIKNRTHWVEKSGAIKFDGNITGKDVFLMEDNTYLVRVSDHTLAADEFVGSSVTVYMQGEDPEEMTIEITESQITDLSANGIPAVSVGNPIGNSCRENALVLDTFGGSGSTLMACEQMNRICYMMELDEKYASVILRRYVDNTGDADNVYVVRDGVKFTYAELAKEVEKKK